MRSHLLSFVMIATAACLGSHAAAEPVFRVEMLRALSADEERARGIANVPPTMVELARLRGISILAEPGSETAEARLPLVQDALAKMPEPLLAYPPKAIILGDRGLRMLPAGLASARAIGPYIVLGEGFFATKGLRAVAPQRRPWMLAHEWGHILQYYSVDLAKEGRLDLTTHATLMRGWIGRFGWQQDALKRWQLPPEQKAGTTAYGATDPVEDQADAVAALFMGKPELVSPERIAFLAEVFRVSPADFTKGVLPTPPPLAPVGRIAGPLRRMLDEMLPVGDETAHFVTGEPVDLADFVADFSTDMAARGFVVEAPLTEIGQQGNMASLRGVWRYEPRRITLAGVGLEDGDGTKLFLRLVTETEN